MRQIFSIIFVLLAMTLTAQTKTFNTKVKIKQTPNAGTTDNVMAIASDGEIHRTQITVQQMTDAVNGGGDFLPLTGGTLTGNLVLSGSASLTANGGITTTSLGVTVANPGGGNIRTTNNNGSFQFGMSGALDGSYLLWDVTNSQQVHDYLLSRGHRFFVANNEVLGLSSTQASFNRPVKIQPNSDMNELAVLRAQDRFSDIILSDNGGSIRLRNDQGNLNFFTNGVADSDNAGSAVNVLNVSTSSITAFRSINISGSTPSYRFLKETENRTGTLQTATLTADRSWVLPDDQGTIALTSNLDSYLPLAGGTLTGGLFANGGLVASSGTFNGNLTVSTGNQLFANGGLTATNTNVNGSFTVSANNPSVVIRDTNNSNRMGSITTPSNLAANSTYTLPGQTTNLIGQVDLDKWVTVSGAGESEDLSIVLGSDEGLGTQLSIIDDVEQVRVTGGSGLRVDGGINFRTSTSTGSYANLQFNGTVGRGYTFPSDKSGTVALISDLPTQAVQTAKISLTASQINNATEIFGINAPGVDKFIQITSLAFSYNFGTTQFTGSGGISIRYAGNAANVITDFGTPAIYTGNVMTYITIPSGAAISENAALAFRANPALATGDGTIDIYVTYVIMDK